VAEAEKGGIMGFFEEGSAPEVKKGMFQSVLRGHKKFALVTS